MTGDCKAVAKARELGRGCERWTHNRAMSWSDESRPDLPQIFATVRCRIALAALTLNVIFLHGPTDSSQTTP